MSVFPIRISYKVIADNYPGEVDAASVAASVTLTATTASAKAPSKMSSQASALQAGFSASSRTFKKAVDRNRIKRLLRECYRKQKADLYDQLSVRKKSLAIFIIYTGKELPAYELVEVKIKQAIVKLIAHLSN